MGQARSRQLQPSVKHLPTPRRQFMVAALSTKPMMLERVAYQPPSWAARLTPPPIHGRVVLLHAATPVFKWRFSGLADLGVEWVIKRDDLSGLEISGNKARKLEFLLAEALALGHDCVVTVPAFHLSPPCIATIFPRALYDILSSRSNSIPHDQLVSVLPSPPPAPLTPTHAPLR